MNRRHCMTYHEGVSYLELIQLAVVQKENFLVLGPANKYK